MILLGKFSETIGVGDSLKDNFDKSKQCVTIADDYAIEFAVWVAKEFWSTTNCKYSAVQTPKELLEIFKKEKGL
jgi:phospholipase/lecithinase/hemolysin